MPPVTELPGEIVLPTRQTLVDRWKRNHRIRVPEADIGPGTQPDVDARINTDIVLPVYAAAKIAGQNSVLEESRDQALDQWGEREGVGERREAVGASGFVKVVASTGGGTIVAGDELIHEDSRLRFAAITTQLYFDGEAAPVIGVDTGPDTNLPAGTPLKWSSPRPGIGQIATVLAQTDGSGLSGGRDRETNDEYLGRIKQEKQTRAASGNDAEYQIEAERTPTVAVQKAFTYPAIKGPGTTCLVFTLRPLTAGGSRIPNAAQIALVESHVIGKFPGDDGAFFGTLVEQNADVVYSVEWDEAAAGWEDAVQWPPYYMAGGTPGAIVVQSATSPTSFILKAANDVYTNVLQPQVGQTIGFYETAATTELKFRRKRILSFTGTGPWTITVDTTNSVSDTSYTPVTGQRAMPWSDALDKLLPGLLAYFDSLGPGEQVATFYDEGRRQKRIPRPPKTWPMTLAERALIAAVSIDDVADVGLLEGDGVTPSVGTPGVLSNILKLRFVSVFPE